MEQKIVVVGAGMMGSGIAAVAALAGNDVILNDTAPEKAESGRERALACVKELEENGLASHKAARGAEKLMRASGDLEESTDKAQLVIESVFENLALKQELFYKLDQMLAPEIPILSNTSGLRITDIAARTERYPERTMTAHFWLPAHLVPLVEVVMWEKTDEALAQSVKELLAGWGKAPVLVRKDFPGQLANRILQAIIREAINIVDMGLASAEDVDTAIKMGMGMRFPAWGPLEHIDAIGLDLALSVQESVLPGISGAEDAPALRAMVEAGLLGCKSGRGFYDWTKRDMDEAVRKRNEFILCARKEIFKDAK